LITDVKVKEIDDSARYLYPNRRIEIKTSGRPIITPIRAATSYEYKEKAKVPTDITIDNPVSISVENLNHSRFEKFMQTNSYFTKLMGRIELNDRLAQYSDLKLVLLRPTVTPKRDPRTKEIIKDSPMSLLRNNANLRDRFIRFIIKLQLDLDLNPITIPYIELPFQIFQDVSFQIARSLEQINRQPLFFVDMKYKEFESAIDWIANQIQSNAIGLYYRPFRTAPVNYDILSRYVDKDIAFISAQIRRYDPTYYDISTMHYLPFLGNDIYAVSTPSPFFTRDTGSRTRLRDRLQSIRLFDKNSLCLNQVRLASTTIDELIYEYRDDSVITNILRNYHEANEDADKLKVLRAFSKISELKDSSSEFIRLQDFVRQNSTRDYLQEKQVLQRTLQEVTGSQSKLNRI